MPRNRSEKLPRCPEAHVYADAAAAWCGEDKPSKLPYFYWTDIPESIRGKINADTLDGVGGIRCGRLKRIAYIREHYGKD